MPKVVIKTATEARREFFDLINAAYYAGQETVVTKNGKWVAALSPTIKRDREEQDFDWESYRRHLRAMWGAWRNLPEDTNRKRMRQAWEKRIKERNQ